MDLITALLVLVAAIGLRWVTLKAEPGSLTQVETIPETDVPPQEISEVNASKFFRNAFSSQQVGEYVE